MDTYNGGYIKPDGYTATYLSFQRYACLSHDTYTPFCNACGYHETNVPVTLGGDILALILDREDGSVIDWVETDTPWETAQSLAHSGDVVISESAWSLGDKPKNLEVLILESTLYADCFGKEYA